MMRPQDIETVRRAVEKQIARCHAKAAELADRGDQFGAAVEWWTYQAERWSRETERRIALGADACNGWAGVRL
jgi:hypothetical protein